MVKGLMPKKVNRNVGMNPIARAVARENLRKAVTDQKIQLYLIQEGEPCRDNLGLMLAVFTAFVTAAERDKTVGADVREVRILKGAISACDQMIADNSYRQANTTTLDVALDCAVELSKRVDPALFNAAWNDLSGGA
jgi:hypothetical protein